MRLVADYLEKIKYYVSFIRVYNTRSMILFYLLGRRLGGKLIFDYDLLVVVIIFIIVYAHASIINFIYDRDIDRKNKKYNPIQNSSVNSKVLSGLSRFAPAAGIVICFFATDKIAALAGCLILFVLSYLYSHPRWRWSHNPWGKLGIMTVFYLVVPAAMGLGKINPASLMIVLPLIVYYASFFLYSDITDIEGDRFFGKRTFAVVLGVRRLLWVSTLLGTVAAIYLCTQTLDSRLVGGRYSILILLMIISPALMQFAVALWPKIADYKLCRVAVGYLLIFVLLFFIFR